MQRAHCSLITSLFLYARSIIINQCNQLVPYSVLTKPNLPDRSMQLVCLQVAGPCMRAPVVQLFSIFFFLLASFIFGICTVGVGSTILYQSLTSWAQYVDQRNELARFKVMLMRMGYGLN